jgi:hypothetical protein
VDVLQERVVDQGLIVPATGLVDQGPEVFDQKQFGCCAGKSNIRPEGTSGISRARHDYKDVAGGEI